MAYKKSTKVKGGGKKGFFSSYVSYLRDNPHGYWFKRKLYGWGWTPVTWHGWLVTLLFIFGLVINGLSFASRVPPTSGDVLLFLSVIVLLVVSIILIAYCKGESPRWSWGL